MTYPRISVITPSFNDAKYLETTIQSVLNQNYPNLEYIVIDGGSTDGSVDIIRKYEQQITYWESGKDDGMYHAIQKGFDRSTGEIMGWINSDDKHQPGSLFTLGQVFSDFKDVQWVQGIPTFIDEKDRIYCDPHTFEVDKFFFYRNEHIKTRRFIQQESTFWRRSLWEKAGGHVAQNYRYAGDFELWIRFFQYEKLYRINCILASFRITSGGQASFDSLNDYLRESVKILESYPLPPGEKIKVKYLSFFERAFQVPNKMKRVVDNKFRVQSIVKDQFYFDPTQQKLKTW